MGPGIGEGLEELRIVVRFHVNEIGVLEFRGDAGPFPEIRRGHDLPLRPFLPDGELETEGMADPVVGHAEGVDGKVTDLERVFIIRPDFQFEERRLPKVPAGKMGDVLPVNVHRDPAVLQDSERGIVNVIGVQVGDDDPIDPEEGQAQGPAAGPHRGKAGVDEQGGPVRFQQQGIARAAAAEGLEGYGQDRTLMPRLPR